ncbi:MAG: DNA adenine methylase [Thermodesulfobium sp.]
MDVVDMNKFESKNIEIQNSLSQKYVDSINTLSMTYIPQFRLIGSKYRLLNQIAKVVKLENISGSSFFDAFSGSAIVGRFFKTTFNILSTDKLYFSYILQKTLIELNEYPKFKYIDIPKISIDNKCRIKQILRFLNNIQGLEGFITDHYTPMSLKVDNVERKYFSIENGKKIDAIREKIQDLFITNQINEEEYFYLLTSLLFSVQKVSNISGTYGAYNKFWDPRSKKPIMLNFIEVISSPFSHKAYNEDVFDLIKNINVDIAYLDPPYNSRQYITNYHLLETIAKYDAPKISGLTGIREYSEREKSVFCNKVDAGKYFLILLKKLQTRNIIISYNSDGIMSKEEMLGLLEESDYKKIKIYESAFKKFKSNGNTDNTKIKEYIFVGRR